MRSHTRFNWLFLLAGVFTILAPASVVSETSFAEPAKYARLLTTILIVALGAATGRGLRLGKAGWAFVAFLMVFGGAGSWSTAPHYALFYKGMFTLSALSGLVLIYTIRSEDELKRGFRLLGLIAGAAAFVAIGVYWRDPGASTTLGRIDVFGLNANMLGQTAAALFILCLFVALNRPPRWMKVSMLTSCGMLGLLIIGTGSRASVLMAMCGMLMLMLPTVKRPGMVVTLVLGGMLIVYLAVEILDLSGGDRLVKDLSKNTRAEVWTQSLRLFAKSPLLGIGWFQFQNRQANLHSAYLQVLVESGAVGALSLMIALGVMVSSWCRNHVQLGRAGRSRDLSYLTAALLFPVLLHGLAESATFISAGLNALFLGMGVGLLDRTVALAASPRGAPGRQRPAQPPPIRWGIVPGRQTARFPALSPAQSLLPPDRPM